MCTSAQAFCTRSARHTWLRRGGELLLAWDKIRDQDALILFYLGSVPV